MRAFILISVVVVGAVGCAGNTGGYVDGGYITGDFPGQPEQVEPPTIADATANGADASTAMSTDAGKNANDANDANDASAATDASADGGVVDDLGAIEDADADGASTPDDDAGDPSTDAGQDVDAGRGRCGWDGGRRARGGHCR